MKHFAQYNICKSSLKWLENVSPMATDKPTSSIRLCSWWCKGGSLHPPPYLLYITFKYIWYWANLVILPFSWGPIHSARSGLLIRPHVGYINAPASARRCRTFLLPMRPHPNNQNVAILSMSIYWQNPKVMWHCVSLRKRKEGTMTQFTISQLVPLSFSKVFPFSSAQRSVFERVPCKCDPDPKIQALHSSLAALYPVSGG